MQKLNLKRSLLGFVVAIAICGASFGTSKAAEVKPAKKAVAIEYLSRAKQSYSMNPFNYFRDDVSCDTWGRIFGLYYNWTSNPRYYWTGLLSVNNYLYADSSLTTKANAGIYFTYGPPGGYGPYFYRLTVEPNTGRILTMTFCF